MGRIRCATRRSTQRIPPSPDPERLSRPTQARRGEMLARSLSLRDQVSFPLSSVYRRFGRGGTSSRQGQSKPSLREPRRLGISTSRFRNIFQDSSIIPGSSPARVSSRPIRQSCPLSVCRFHRRHPRRFRGRFDRGCTPLSGGLGELKESRCPPLSLPTSSLWVSCRSQPH